MGGQNGQTRLEASQQKGIESEARVVRVLNDPGWFGRPAWFMAARLGTKQEDHRGIDIVIQTSAYGFIFLQVKSSVHRAEVWKRQHPNTDIVLVVVSCLDSDSVLRENVMSEIQSSLRSSVRERVDTRRVSNGSQRRR